MDNNESSLDYINLYTNAVLNVIFNVFFFLTRKGPIQARVPRARKSSYSPSWNPWCFLRACWPRTSKYKEVMPGDKPYPQSGNPLCPPASGWLASCSSPAGAMRVDLQEGSSFFHFQAGSSVCPSLGLSQLALTVPRLRTPLSPAQSGSVCHPTPSTSRNG